MILIATPNDAHKEIAIKALQAGKHVICEKPVTISSGDLLDIVKVADKEKRIFTVHQNRRWDDDYRIARELIDKGTIGELLHVESRVQGANGIPGDWRQLKAHGGGMLLDWGVHLLDQLLQITDSPIESVAATLSYVLGTEVDDGFTSHIKFNDGLTAVIEVGTTNYVTLPRWYIKGTEGTALIKDWDLNGEIIIRNADAAHTEPKPIQAGQGLTKTMAPPSEESTLSIAIEKPAPAAESFYENFVSVIEGRAEPAIKNEEVHRVLVLIETIFEAAEHQQVIRRSI
ncbi:putative oxidoreductase YdgJ [compost metagenome]